MEIQWPLAVFTLFTGLAGWLFFFTGLNELIHKSERDGFLPGVIAIVLPVLGSFASALACLPRPWLLRLRLSFLRWKLPRCSQTFRS